MVALSGTLTVSYTFTRQPDLPLAHPMWVFLSLAVVTEVESNNAQPPVFPLWFPSSTVSKIC